jgi:ABC-2 type transport system permease protein
VVARREFSVRVRTLWFVAVTLLGPIGMLGLILVPAWLSHKSVEEGVTIQLLDHTADRVGDSIAEDLRKFGSYFQVEAIAPDTSETELLRRIRDRAIDGYLRVPKDLLDGGTVSYRGANATNLGVVNLLEEAVVTAVRRLRAKKAGIDAASLEILFARVGFEAEHTTGTATATSGAASFALGYAVMFVLYIGILLYAVNVMRSVVEEKSSRVIEIMVSTIKPFPLMLGKILGVGSVGLLQLAVWVGMAVLIFHYRTGLLGLFGVSGGGGDFELPSLDAIAVAVILGYFLLGFFFYASLYAAIGAMVNSEQEAQQVQTPVVLLLIIPVACVQLIANDPRGGAAELLTLIPFSAPILMPMRYLLGGATGLDVLASLALLLLAFVLAAWLSARIYRVGVLMYGKRPSLRELARWIRY